MEDRELIRVVLDFAREMNDLEGTSSLSDFIGNRSQQYRTRLNAIWSRYLTPRKMQKSVGSFHSPPLFRNVTKDAACTVEETGKNRCVVEVLVDGFASDFRFGMVYRSGEWRIDSLKQRFHSMSGATEKDKWEYGSL